MYCAVGLSAMGTVRFKYDSGRKKITGLLRAVAPEQRLPIVSAQVDKVLFHNPCYNRVSVLRHEDQMILQDVAAVPVFMRFFLRPARHGCPLLD